MASTSDSTSIIKSDRIGRTRYSAEYKAEVVAAFEDSGMSGPAFAEQCGIKYPTFASWVAKSRTAGGPPSTAEAGQQFLLAEVDPAAGETSLRVDLPGGAVAHVTTASQAALLGEMLKSLA